MRSLSRLRAHARQTIDRLASPERSSVQLTSAAVATQPASTWRWAKVTSVQTSTFKAKLVNDAGNVTGDELTVNVAACTMTGVTTTPTLATELPWIQVGVELMIEERTGRRPGWWLAGHNVTTCTGS